MFAPLSSAILSLSTSAARAFDAGMAAALAVVPANDFDMAPVRAFADVTGADFRVALDIVCAILRGERMTGAEVVAAVEAYAVETEALRVAAAARRAALAAERAAHPVPAPVAVSMDELVYPRRPLACGGFWVGD